MKKIASVLLFCVLSVLIIACSRSEKKGDEIFVGTISGPETSLMEVAKKVALEKYGLVVNIVEFTDYTLPNAALDDGSLNANVFQHLPYLESDIAARHYKLSPIGKTFIYPMAIYSKNGKKEDLTQLKDKAVVAIPNDPSNEGRALVLLQKTGLIELKPGVGYIATTRDIVSNPKQIEIKEIDAAQLPRVLADVDLAIINTNYAALADLRPDRDALLVEDKDSPYANIIVVRSADVDNPKLKQLVEALHSDEVKEAAQKLFNGQAFPAW